MSVRQLAGAMSQALNFLTGLNKLRTANSGGNPAVRLLVGRPECVHSASRGGPGGVRVRGPPDSPQQASRSRGVGGLLRLSVQVNPTWNPDPKD